MKIRKILAFLTAVTLTCLASSCTLRGKGDSSEESDSKKSDSDDERDEDDDEGKGDSEKTSVGDFCPIKDSKRLDDVRKHVNTLIDDLKTESNEDDIQKSIDTLLADFDELYEEYTNLTIPYYLDMDDESLEEEADDAYEDLCIAGELITLAFCRGYNSGEYKELFADLIIDKEALESYSDPALTMNRVEGYARVESWITDDRIDRYQDIAYDDDMDDDEKNLKCAEILLEIFRDYDTEMFYEQYCRDYTPDEMMALTEIVKTEMIPVSDEILEGIFSIDNVMDILDEPVEFDNPFETIAEYAPELSPEIEKAANKLLEDKEYSITDGDGSYEGSFTTYLPVSEKGVIYITDNNDYYSLLTPVHEFGHYYAMGYDDVPTYLATSNLDIAEIQSQGFECVFTRFYDDIYEDQSDAMFAAKTYDLVYAVITGFGVGEFEYTLLKNIDDYSPEDVVELWEDIAEDSMPGIELYMINHMFESPGYYISYAVSALAAFDIWRDCLDDPEEALEKYEKIARISYNDKDYAFRSAIAEAGINDVLDKKYIADLASELSEYAESLG